MDVLICFILRHGNSTESFVSSKEGVVPAFWHNPFGFVERIIVLVIFSDRFPVGIGRKYRKNVIFAIPCLI